MCIRDRQEARERLLEDEPVERIARRGLQRRDLLQVDRARDCLLYTSDAADERSSVDLGGRRIIKKQNILVTHDS